MSKRNPEYLKRTVDEKIEDWYKSNIKVLFIYGARQVGKSKSINRFLDNYEKDSYRINISEIEDSNKLKVFNKIFNPGLTYVENILYILKPHENHKSKIVFIDEIQEVSRSNNYDKDNEIINNIFSKLLKDKEYRFIISGSLLGIKLKNIKFEDVSNVESIKMFPITFEEFCINFDVKYKKHKEYLENQIYKKEKIINKKLHMKFLELYSKYFYIGGMPICVSSFKENFNIDKAYKASEIFLKLYSKDVEKYFHKYLSEEYKKNWVLKIYDEINNANKEGNNKEINKQFKIMRDLLIKSDIALSVIHIEEKGKDISMQEKYKLYFNDISIYRNGMFKSKPMKIKFSDRYNDFNLQIKGKKVTSWDKGFETEQIVAQELKSRYDDKLFYFYNNNKAGECEIEFIIFDNNKKINLEIKSGGFESFNSINRIGLNENCILYTYLPYCGKLKNNIYCLPIYSLLLIDPTKYIKIIKNEKPNKKLNEIIKDGKLPTREGFY